MDRTRDHTVGISGLNHQGAEIKNIGCFLAGFLHRHPLFLAKLEQNRCIAVYHCVIQRIDDCSLGNIIKTICGSYSAYFVGISEENNLGNFIFKNMIRGIEIADFVAFG